MENRIAIMEVSRNKSDVVTQTVIAVRVKYLSIHDGELCIMDSKTKQNKTKQTKQSKAKQSENGQDKAKRDNVLEGTQY